MITTKVSYIYENKKTYTVINTYFSHQITYPYFSKNILIDSVAKIQYDVQMQHVVFFSMLGDVDFFR
jgi:hypothetical protein